MTQLNYRYIKRALDFSLSAVLITALLPLMTLIALALRLLTDDRIIYREKRVGLGGKVFTMYKFKACSYAGMWIKKRGLDSLPMLFNVLKGDMAFVGPRAAYPDQLDEIAMRRSNGASRARPGLTGLSQANERLSALTLREKALYDVIYLREMCFSLDLKCALNSLSRYIPQMESVGIRRHA